MTTGIMEKQGLFEGKATLVRRVSDLFRAEGNNSETSLLIRHTSMQKLRHCCQNLNLFPILLYSFGHPKALPMPMSKVNLAALIAKITERIYRVYSSISYTIIQGLRLKSIKPSVIATTDPTFKTIPLNNQQSTSSKIVSRQSEPKFEKFILQKRKSNSLFLKLVVYSAPLLLAFQLIGLFSLMIFDKYPPGFVFLFSALIFLGCISMKVLNHDVAAVKSLKRNKRKDD